MSEKKIEAQDSLLSVAYQGTLGSYSETALFEWASKKGLEYKPHGCETFDEVFEKLLTGQTDLTFLPIENVLTGSVVPTYDLLLKNLEVVFIGEYILSIEHKLLACSSATLESINSVYSHPQALAQCRPFLVENKYEAVSHYDTAGAAEYVSKLNDPTMAALASSRAGKLYNLKTLNEKPAERENMTRFHVMCLASKKDEILKTISKRLGASQNFKEKREGEKNAPDTTSLIFRTKHIPASLHKALSGFAHHDINLLKIESRPDPRELFSYVFFLDHEGVVSEQSVRFAHKILEMYCLDVRVLGEYKRVR